MTADEELLKAEARRALEQLRKVRLLVRLLRAEGRLDGEVAQEILDRAVVRGG